MTKRNKCNIDIYENPFWVLKSMLKNKLPSPKKEQNWSYENTQIQLIKILYKYRCTNYTITPMTRLLMYVYECSQKLFIFIFYCNICLFFSFEFR